ncbi:MAG: tetratricopeptide repeat protein, partial [Sinobacteraceae bacterium]|nr:tetratricopeptide repeat protein [Nevskiaceae bacterium]
VREYGRERLERRGDTDTTSYRHAQFFLALAEHAEPELLGPRWMEARARFAQEQDNIRAALRWLTTRGDTEHALGLAGSLARFWFFHGYFDEGNAWLTRVLTLPGSAPTAGRAQCLHGIGTIAMMRGDVAAAETALHEALGIWRELGNLAQQGFVLFVLGMAARQHGARSEASRLFEAGLAASRAAGCAPAEANNLSGLADVTREQGLLAPARAYGEQALRCASAAGYLRGEVHALRALGEITQELGEYRAAAQLLESGLAKSRELGAQWLSAWSLVRLGCLAIQQGDYAQADALLAESLELSRQMGDRRGIDRCLEGLAELARAQGQEATRPPAFTENDRR